MLTRVLSAIPLAPVDVLFAKSLAWLSPRVGGQACIPDCSTYVTCGSGCDGQCSTRFCDACGGGFCDCVRDC